VISPKIDLIIAGAQKAGTSSLKKYLSQHPKIKSHLNLECDYFANTKNSFDTYYTRYFQPATTQEIILAKYAHLTKQDSFVENLFNHNPEVKIIFCIREPLSRLQSAYNMGIQNGWIKFTPDELIKGIKEAEKGQYSLSYNVLVKQGDYARVANLLTNKFPTKHILFLSFRELCMNAQKECNRIFDFMGISSVQIKDISIENKANSKGQLMFNKLWQNKHLVQLKEHMPYSVIQHLKKMLVSKQPQESNPIEWPPEIIKEIKEYYQMKNRRFEEITGIDINSLY